MPEPQMKYSFHKMLIQLTSRRFVGFTVSVVAIYFNPEIQNSIVLLYGALTAYSAASDHFQRVDTKNITEKDL
jgi:hypothetical protein